MFEELGKGTQNNSIIMTCYNTALTNLSLADSISPKRHEKEEFLLRWEIIESGRNLPMLQGMCYCHPMPWR